MKKNKMMRLASVLLVLTLLSTSVISGTFAKYTTSVTANDSARVATWGFTGVNADIAITDLFDVAYLQNQVDSKVLGYANIIAPGTTNSASFQFKYDGAEVAPEVAYDFTVSVANSSIGPNIEDNDNIRWRLNHNDTKGTWGDWDALMGNILSLSGTPTEFDGTNMTVTKRYSAQQLPAAFSADDDTYTIEWEWIFETADDPLTTDKNEMEVQDKLDTAMGNANPLETVAIYITITATQVD